MNTCWHVGVLFVSLDTHADYFAYAWLHCLADGVTFLMQVNGLVQVIGLARAARQHPCHRAGIVIDTALILY